MLIKNISELSDLICMFLTRLPTVIRLKRNAFCIYTFELLSNLNLSNVTLLASTAPSAGDGVLLRVM